ncbi:MAG: hypothetical protein ACREVY_09090 [Gammaproteobacteria bacterium]
MRTCALMGFSGLLISLSGLMSEPDWRCVRTQAEREFDAVAAALSVRG